MSSDSQKSAVPTKGGATWRRSIARLLRGLIRILDWAVTELETESTLPAAAASRTTRPALLPAQVGHAALAWARPWLPESLRKLSDRNLTIALSIMGAAVLVAAIAIFPPKFPTATVATQPPEVKQPPLKPLLPTLLELPSEPAESADTAESNQGKPTPEPTPIAEPEPIAQPPSPPPKLERSPEQALIAAIQDATSEIATRYGDSALVESIRADFRTSRLIVTVPRELWYGLGDRTQDRFAADLLQRSRRLDFSKLELQDSAGELLARSPVVGDRVVIFQRSADSTS